MWWGIKVKNHGHPWSLTLRPFSSQHALILIAEDPCLLTTCIWFSSHDNNQVCELLDGCPQRFPHKNDVGFPIIPLFVLYGVMLCYVTVGKMQGFLSKLKLSYTTTCDWSACTKSGKWTVLNMGIRGIGFDAMSTILSIRFWNYSNCLVFFASHFIIRISLLR